MASSATLKVPDLHKSAFWIYGVTAMVMRDPLGDLLRHLSAAGWRDAGVQMEALRTTIVLLLMSKHFLASGIFFDRVYIRPEAGELYPKRSYPVDFLFGMATLLTSVGASELVAVPTVVYDGVIVVNLLFSLMWLATAKALGHSTIPRLKFAAIWDLGTLAIFAAVLTIAETPAYLVLIPLVAIQMARMIRGYNDI